MKWTPSNDQLLFMKLLETHDVSVKAEKIRDAWPKGGEVPTARAISERIGKIRNAVRASGSGTGSTPSTPRKRKGSEAPRTPIAKVRRSGQDGDKSESSAVRSKRLAAKAVTREESEGEDSSV